MASLESQVLRELRYMSALHYPLFDICLNMDLFYSSEMVNSFIIFFHDSHVRLYVDSQNDNIDQSNLIKAFMVLYHPT